MQLKFDMWLYYHFVMHVAHPPIYLSTNYDIRVKEWYMNKLKSHLNERDFEDRMVKKDFKKLKITIYTKVHLSI